jgi:hypothetical protein
MEAHEKEGCEGQMHTGDIRQVFLSTVESDTVFQSVAEIWLFED